MAMAQLEKRANDTPQGDSHVAMFFLLKAALGSEHFFSLAPTQLASSRNRNLVSTILPSMVEPCISKCSVKCSPQ